MGGRTESRVCRHVHVSCLLKSRVCLERGCSLILQTMNANDERKQHFTLSWCTCNNTMVGNKPIPCTLLRTCTSWPCAQALALCAGFVLVSLCPAIKRNMTDVNTPGDACFTGSTCS